MQMILGDSPMNPLPALPSPFMIHDTDILKTSSGIFINAPEHNLVYWQPTYDATLSTLTPYTAYALINGCVWVQPYSFD